MWFVGRFSWFVSCWMERLIANALVAGRWWYPSATPRPAISSSPARRKRLVWLERFKKHQNRALYSLLFTHLFPQIFTDFFKKRWFLGCFNKERTFRYKQFFLQGTNCRPVTVRVPAWADLWVATNGPPLKHDVRWHTFTRGTFAVTCFFAVTWQKSKGFHRTMRCFGALINLSRAMIFCKPTRHGNIQCTFQSWTPTAGHSSSEWHFWHGLTPRVPGTISYLPWQRIYTWNP